ncbi:putative P-loop containing nucleoside triphosphate hydrolase, leucine-rich repeat domain superfamily [Helianthus debilis subsp. tardiflorus]
MAEAGISSVIGKVVDLLFGVAIKEISYMCNCSENVEKYKKEADKLSRMKERVQQQIDSAKSKGENLLAGVEEWMEEADAEISMATQFINQEDQKKCFHLCTLRRCSKTAIKKTFSLQQHQEDGNRFETCVSVPAQAPGFTDLYQRKNLEDIDTHKSILEDIIRAIEDDTTQIVGINGLGGVGKTTLASEVAKAIKNKFADIVFITVKQTVDVKMIQEKVGVAASRIMNGEKVLIILDDVWEELKLEELGIPCGSEYMNCKILLTSRSRDVCAAMNAQKNISVNPLQEEEAWTLFERVVGKSEWNDTLKEVALAIVNECGGLPLFIQAVGKALKDKEIKIWEAALRRLQAPMDGDVSYKKEGILQLKLSYDYLEDEVAKSLFLLCSMFPEDGSIGLKTLTRYGLALGIFNNPDSIHDTKDIVQLAVESLKSSFLLLPADIDYYSPVESLLQQQEEEELFKMHDVVRDMALFITFKGDDKFLVKSGKGLREWQPRSDVIKSYKKISLVENKICKLPDYELDLPYLDTFLIQKNELPIVPDEFFRGMKELKVLNMGDNNILSLPQSLTQLTMLRLLDLSGNRYLCEISILGGLSCLEILKLRRTGIINIPKEIGQLTNLRLLDVYYCTDLSYVTPGVISKLIRLEELYVWLFNPHQYISFCNLMSFTIRNCPSLLKLFPISVAQGLVNLKYLRIEDCESLVNVISDGDEQTTGSEIELVKKDTNIVFSFTYIFLNGLPKLESFYSGHSIIKYPSLEVISVSKCPSMKRWSYGENHTANITFYDDEERECSINDYIVGKHEKNVYFTKTEG